MLDRGVNINTPASMFRAATRLKIDGSGLIKNSAVALISPKPFPHDTLLKKALTKTMGIRKVGDVHFDPQRFEVRLQQLGNLGPRRICHYDQLPIRREQLRRSRPLCCPLRREDNCSGTRFGPSPTHFQTTAHTEPTSAVPVVSRKRKRVGGALVEQVRCAMSSFLQEHTNSKANSEAALAARQPSIDVELNDVRNTVLERTVNRRRQKTDSRAVLTEDLTQVFTNTLRHTRDIISFTKRKSDADDTRGKLVCRLRTQDRVRIERVCQERRNTAKDPSSATGCV